LSPNDIFPRNDGAIKNHIPFPDFARGSTQATTNGNSIYNGLQLTVEKRFSAGLNLLATYTWSKSLTDATDLLNGNNTNYRGPSIPGFGIQKDYGLSPSDSRNVFHLSGGYELPFGKGKKYMSGGGVANKIAGGWSILWTAQLNSGQPRTLGCPTGTTTGTNCNAMLVKGVDPNSGPHNVRQFWNPQAFAQPCVLKLTDSNDPNSPVIPDVGNPSGCIPLTGVAALGGGPTQVIGPPFKRLDFSTFKDFQLSERFRLQFRAEFFNILNHPNFNAPGFGGNGVNSISGSTDFTPHLNTSTGVTTYGSGNFGAIGSTRDAPNDPRQIQFALKLYY